mmetsp:Transcript_27223/g.43006  ORF Transcript_27223/g.43006 Transcript_27223/m.43006 type:complete len:292 (+) Transcript_27223:366-1241(+)
MQLQRQHPERLLDLHGDILDARENKTDEKHGEDQHRLGLVLPPRAHAEFFEFVHEREREEDEPYPEESHGVPRVSQRDGSAQHRLAFAEGGNDVAQLGFEERGLLKVEGGKATGHAEGYGGDRGGGSRDVGAQAAIIASSLGSADRQSKVLLPRRGTDLPTPQVIVHDPAVEDQARLREIVRGGSLLLRESTAVGRRERQQLPHERFEQGGNLPRVLRPETEAIERPIAAKHQQQPEYGSRELEGRERQFYFRKAVELLDRIVKVDGCAPRAEDHYGGEDATGRDAGEEAE